MLTGDKLSEKTLVTLVARDAGRISKDGLRDVLISGDYYVMDDFKNKYALGGLSKPNLVIRAVQDHGSWNLLPAFHKKREFTKETIKALEAEGITLEDAPEANQQSEGESEVSIQSKGFDEDEVTNDAATNARTKKEPIRKNDKRGRFVRFREWFANLSDRDKIAVASVLLVFAIGIATVAAILIAALIGAIATLFSNRAPVPELAPAEIIIGEVTEAASITAPEATSAEISPSTTPIPDSDGDELTHKETPTVQTKVASSSSPCIRAGSEYWTTTWLGRAEESGPRSRSSTNLDCYDFLSLGFSSAITEPDQAFALRVECGTDTSICKLEDSAAGIFTELPDGEYEFLVRIDQIDIESETSDLSDVDLIIGIGDPLTASGRFIIFRLVNKMGDIHFCSDDTYNTFCNPIARIDPPSFGTRLVTINIGESPTLSLDGTILGQSIAEEPLSRTLWIGFGFRSQGEILAVIEFPPSLFQLLSVD